jgi:hypothetical protein
MVRVLDMRDTCERISRQLDCDVLDEITLLRAARTLKRVSYELRLAAQRYLAKHGRTPCALLAHEAVLAAEHHLQAVLINDEPLSERDVRDHLIHAVFRSLDALTLLGR